MNTHRLLVALGFGALIILAIGSHAFWFIAGFVAVLSFLAGCFGAKAAVFFSGAAFGLVCAVFPGLFLGNPGDRYMSVLEVPLLILGVFGVAGVCFPLGKLINARFRALRP